MGYNPLQMLMSGGATGLNKKDIIGKILYIDMRNFKVENFG